MEKKKLEILVVEDIPENMEVAKRCFNSIEVNADFASDYEQAITKLKEKRYDGVLTDLCIPEETGTKRIDKISPFLDKVLTYWKNRMELEDKTDPYYENLLIKPIERMRDGVTDQIPCGALIVEYCSLNKIPCMHTSKGHEENMYPIKEYLGEVLKSKSVGSVSDERTNRNLGKDDINYWREAYKRMKEYLTQK